MSACCYEPMKNIYCPKDPFPPIDPILYPPIITIDC